MEWTMPRMLSGDDEHESKVLYSKNSVIDKNTENDSENNNEDNEDDDNGGQVDRDRLAALKGGWKHIEDTFVVHTRWIPLIPTEHSDIWVRCPKWMGSYSKMTKMCGLLSLLS